MAQNTERAGSNRPPVTGSSPLVTSLHVLLALAGWVVFAVMWHRVFYRTPPHESAVGVLIVAAFLVVSVTLTVAWIRHNVLLAQRYAGRRTRLREVVPDWSRDVLGREIVGPGWEALQEAQEVEIDIDTATGRKTYRAG